MVKAFPLCHRRFVIAKRDSCSDYWLVVQFEKMGDHSWPVQSSLIICVLICSVHQAHSLAPPPPPIGARPKPMDEERSAPAISPEPPDDGDPSLPEPQPSSHATSTTERANSCPNPKPCPSEGEGKRERKQTAVLTPRVLLCACIRVGERTRDLDKHFVGLNLNKLMFKK